MLNFNKAKQKCFKPNLAPLIDVVFLLLIFYMLTLAVLGEGLDVKLPEEASVSDAEEMPLIIEIYRADDIRVGDKLVDLKSLKKLLQSEIAARKNKAVVVQADDKVKYEIFVNVFDLAKQAGASRFSLVM